MTVPTAVPTKLITIITRIEFWMPRIVIAK
ncbi:hypothetical protein QE406_002795 [Microbacterium testaceum]|nr:hypothetical protein [Microbacterium testaceum]